MTGAALRAILIAAALACGAVNAAMAQVVSWAQSQLTLPATTTAYTSGQLIASNATAASVVVPSFTPFVNAGSLPLIGRVRLSTNDTTSTSWGAVGILVDFWSAAPTFNNGDRGAWSLKTGAGKHLGSFSCTMSAMGGDGAYAECAPAVGTFGVPMLATPAPIYWTLQTTGASGVTGASKIFTLTAEIVK